MTDPKQSYRNRRAMICKKAFEGFHPDLSKSRNPKEVLLVIDLASQGLYSKEIAEKIGKTPKAVQKIFRRYNFPDLHNIAPPRMEERHDWKHGIKYCKGYQYKRAPGHPRGSKHGGYVATHRLVMESMIGRHLGEVEVVDHIDGDVTNNQPENLRLFASNAEHLAETLKGRRPNWSKEGFSRIGKYDRTLCKSGQRKKDL